MKHCHILIIALIFIGIMVFGAINPDKASADVGQGGANVLQCDQHNPPGGSPPIGYGPGTCDDIILTIPHR